MLGHQVHTKIDDGYSSFWRQNIVITYIMIYGKMFQINQGKYMELS